MKALILSDSHRDFGSIMRAVENERNADLIIHAGDVHKDVEDILMAWPNIPCVYVIGNNDFLSMMCPKKGFLHLAAKEFF